VALSLQIYSGEAGLEEMSKSGWETIWHRIDSRHESPAFAVIANREINEACLVVRGTASASDALTDLTGIFYFWHIY